MPHVVYDKGHHAGPNEEARIKSRLKPSGGKPGTETWPSRTHTVVHHGQQTPAHDRGEPVKRK